MNDKERLPVGFVYEHELVDGLGRRIDVQSDLNKIPSAGINLLIRAPFGDATPITTFYVGLFRNNALPTDATKASDIPSVLGEFTNYEEAERPLWDKVYDGNGTYSNAANRAEFTFLSDQMIYGAFMVSSAEKGGSGGLVLSAVRFTTPRMIYAGLTLKMTTSLTYVSAEM